MLHGLLKKGKCLTVENLPELLHLIWCAGLCRACVVVLTTWSDILLTDNYTSYWLTATRTERGILLVQLSYGIPTFTLSCHLLCKRRMELNDYSFWNECRQLLIFPPVSLTFPLFYINYSALFHYSLLCQYHYSLLCQYHSLLCQYHTTIPPVSRPLLLCQDHNSLLCQFHFPCSTSKLLGPVPPPHVQLLQKVPLMMQLETWSDNRFKPELTWFSTHLSSTDPAGGTSDDATWHVVW